MSTYDFYTKQGDRHPSLSVTLRDALGAAVDITAATSVTFAAQQVIGGAKLVSGTAAIVSAALGQVRYDLAAGDGDVAGVYEIEFKVHWADGTTTSFPNSDIPKTWLITEELA